MNQNELGQTTEKLKSKASLLFYSGHYSLISVVVTVVLTEMMNNQVSGALNEGLFSLCTHLLNNNNNSNREREEILNHTFHFPTSKI